MHQRHTCTSAVWYLRSWDHTALVRCNTLQACFVWVSSDNKHSRRCPWLRPIEEYQPIGNCPYKFSALHTGRGKARTAVCNHASLKIFACVETPPPGVGGEPARPEVRCTQRSRVGERDTLPDNGRPTGYQWFFQVHRYTHTEDKHFAPPPRPRFILLLNKPSGRQRKFSTRTASSWSILHVCMYTAGAVHACAIEEKHIVSRQQYTSEEWPVG